MPDQVRPSGPKPELKAERRHISVLFCDIAGSSALANRLDPEDLRDILHEYQRCCREAVLRYDGHVARYMGDGVLAYFGFPLAHGDDAERAANCALQMLETISALTFRHAPAIPVRIGIASGFVIIGDLIGEGSSQEFAAVGEAPNLAAALQQTATPNQILVAPQTQRLLGRQFELSDLGERLVKGHDRPVRVWSLLRRAEVSTRFEARITSQLTPLVGREHELGVLRDCFARVRRGTGQVVLMRGEPGIGKSRLLTSFRDELSDVGSRTLWLQCSSYHTNSPLYPVARHLEDAATIQQTDSAPQRREKLEALIDRCLPDERATVTPLLAALLSIPTGDRYPPLELTPQQQRRRTFGALLNVIRTHAAEHPLMLVCEDIHWADPTTRELIEQLRDQSRHWPLLLVLTFRPEFHLPWAAGRRRVTILPVERLSADYTTRMVDSLVGATGLPRLVAEKIVAKTDGVPLFVEEMTKAILEEHGAGLAEGTAGPSTIKVPDTLQDTLMSRLDQQQSSKSVAQVASAFGRNFSLDLLEAVSDLPKHVVRTTIEALLAADLICPGQSDSGTYAFRHALIQDAAYGSMLRNDRRSLHGRIANVLCAQFPGLAETSPEFVAQHLTEAGQFEAAIGYWLKGGRLASGRSSFAEAVTQYQTALKLLSELPDGAERDNIELQLQQSLALATIALKGFGASETMVALGRALQLSERVPGSPHTFAVLNGMVGFHITRGEFEQSLGVASRLLDLAARQDDQTARMMGHRVLGMSLFTLGRLGEASENLRKAMAFYDPAHHASLALMFSQDIKASAQVYLGLTSVLQGEIETGLAHANDALAYAEHLRHPHTICYVLPFVAGCQLIAGMPHAALPVAERTLSLSAEYGFQQWLAGGTMLRGWACVELGRTDEGISEIRRSIDGLMATGTLIWMQFAHLLLARGLAAAGEPGAAMEVIERLVADIAGTSGRWFEADVHRLRGDLSIVLGKSTTEAEACYETGLDVAARQGAHLWQLRAMNSLATFLRSNGRTSEAAARLSTLCGNFNDELVTPDLQRARTMLNEIALSH